MKQGERFLRLVSLITAAAAVCILTAALYRAGKKAGTAEALPVTAAETAQVSCLFIREEQLLLSPFSCTAPLVREGEKVAAGQPVGIGAETAEPAACAEARTALRERLIPLQQAAAVPPAQLAVRIRALLQKLAAGPPAAREDTALLQALILRSSMEEAAWSRLLRGLENQTEAAPEGTALTAPEAGWFSACADGYEKTLTPTALAQQKDPFLLPAAPLPEQAWGRLILSGTWYLAAKLPERPLPEEGDTVEVSLAGGERFSMQVFRADAESGLLVLCSSSGLSEVSHLRSAFCTLTFSRRDALQIPAAALRTDAAGQTGVYVAEGAAARWRPVTVLRMGQSGCTVLPQQTADGILRPGDAVLTGNELYDGKVVYP